RHRGLVAQNAGARGRVERLTEVAPDVVRIRRGLAEPHLSRGCPGMDLGDGVASLLAEAESRLGSRSRLGHPARTEVSPGDPGVDERFVFQGDVAAVREGEGLGAGRLGLAPGLTEQMRLRQ